MKITLVRSMARSAVFELVNSGCYRAPAPYTVSLDGATVCEGDTNVFSLYSLEPGRSYTLAVTLDGVTDTLDFTTAAIFFLLRRRKNMERKTPRRAGSSPPYGPTPLGGGRRYGWNSTNYQANLPVRPCPDGR